MKKHSMFAGAVAVIFVAGGAGGAPQDAAKPAETKPAAQTEEKKTESRSEAKPASGTKKHTKKYKKTTKKGSSNVSGAAAHAAEPTPETKKE